MMNILHNIFYWTGVVAWMIIAAILLVFLMLAMVEFWRREAGPSLQNLRLAFFGKGRLKMTYYEMWCQVYQNRSLRRHLKKRHNHFSRLAYWRVVREARRESRQREPENK